MGHEPEPSSHVAGNVSGNGSSSNARVVSPFERTSRLQHAVKWFRSRMARKPESSLKEVLEDVLDEEAQESFSFAISTEEKNLLKNIIHFGELTVGDIMVPRSEIMGIDKSISVAELNAHVASIAHTRIPVYDGSLDKIEGFLHVKDLFLSLSQGQPFNLATAMRNILFVPPSMRIVDLLLKMRVSGCHMGIVVDEYGGTDGLVTMEDLIEELVGEIQDEHDEDEDLHIEWQGDHVLEVDARTKIDELEETMGERITEGDVHALEFDTIGGLVFAQLGRVPVRGEVVYIKQVKLEILVADPRRIHRIRITRQQHA